MLSSLTINNVALIKNLHLDFCGRLNILSGETGAGKSIIVDGIMLLLGTRFDKSILRYGEERGFVEGVFELNERGMNLLTELGFEEDSIAVINRKFYADGKSEIRINGRSASISMLRNLTGALVDIYGQNEYQSLMHSSEQIRTLNYFLRGATNDILKELGIEFSAYQKICTQLKEIGNEEERARNIDLLKYQLNEIKKAAVRQGEEEELTEKRRIISASEKIAAALSGAKELLYSGEKSADEKVSASAILLSGISAFSAGFESLYSRLDSVSIELEDIAQTLSAELDGLDFEPGVLEKIENRLDVIRSLKRKYGTFEQMHEFYDNSSIHLEKMENSDEEYKRLLKEKTQKINKIYALSKELSAIRRDGALKLEKAVEIELAELGMKGAEFKIVFEPFPALEECESKLSASGLDKSEFYISANSGQPPKPLNKVISGGELSRFILALKVVSGKTDDIPTMIFDEIDTGISGKIGQEVAKKLAVISRSHQVLCVTHLPQIASMADNHYYINKTSSKTETETLVRLLSDNEVIEEISRLSGAKDISTQSSENAREMKKWSECFKSTL